MKKNWIAMAFALALAVTLTACSYDGKNNTTGNGSTGTGNGAASGSVSGSAGQTRNGVYGGTTGRAGYNTPYNGNTADRRTAYDYLNDGRYTADGNGWVNGRTNSVGRDLTRGARDMVRGAGNAVGDVGNGIRNATRDVLNY